MPNPMPHTFHLAAMYLASLASLTLMAGTTLALQPEVLPAPTPGAAAKAPPSISDALDLLHRAYRSGPVADRVVIKATDASGKDRREQVVVYTDVGEIVKEPPAGDKPADAAPTPAATPKPRPAQFRIDLSQLHIHVQDSSLTAVKQTFSRSRFFRIPSRLISLSISRATAKPSLPVTVWWPGAWGTCCRDSEGWTSGCIRARAKALRPGARF